VTSGERNRAWARRLRQPIETKDGLTLHTLDDVRSFLLSVPEQRAQRNVWQHGARLLLAAVDETGDLDALAQQVRLGLLMEGRLRVGDASRKKGP
jgi:hypothetical protein